MNFIKLPLTGVYLIETMPLNDNRGFFERLYCKEEIKNIPNQKPTEIAQINHSFTKLKGSIRGMHFQYPPKAERKIVKCMKGSIFDVIVDIRKGSPTFLKWHGEILSAGNMKMMYVPEGFAHGFQSLENDAEILYFVSAFYDKNLENALRFNDPMIDIKWLLDVTDISEKDKNHPLLKDDFQGIVL